MSKIIVIASTILAFSAPAASQSLDGLIQTVTSLARANLGEARLRDGSLVRAETPADRSRPIVPAALDVQTVRRGALTAQLQACGGDWRAASFLPYMATLRASRRYSERQLAYVGIVHGITQGIVHGSLVGRAQPCPHKALESLNNTLSRPVAAP